MKIAVFSLALVLAGSSALPAETAETFPFLKVANTCRQTIDLTGKKDAQTFDQCMKDEATYKKKAEAEWSLINASGRENCAAMSNMFYPDYVELSVCLDMYRPLPGEPGGGPATATSASARSVSRAMR